MVENVIEMKRKSKRNCFVENLSSYAIFIKVKGIAFCSILTGSVLRWAVPFVSFSNMYVRAKIRRSGRERLAKSPVLREKLTTEEEKKSKTHPMVSPALNESVLWWSILKFYTRKKERRKDYRIAWPPQMVHVILAQKVKFPKFHVLSCP